MLEVDGGRNGTESVDVDAKALSFTGWMKSGLTHFSPLFFFTYVKSYIKGAVSSIDKGKYERLWKEKGKKGTYQLTNREDQTPKQSK